VVKIIARLELDETISFPDAHCLFSLKPRFPEWGAAKNKYLAIDYIPFPRKGMRRGEVVLIQKGRRKASWDLRRSGLSKE